MDQIAPHSIFRLTVFDVCRLSKRFVESHRKSPVVQTCQLFPSNELNPECGLHMDMLFNDSINPVCSVTDYNDFLDFMSVVSFKQCGNMSYEIVYRSDDGYEISL